MIAMPNAAPEASTANDSDIGLAIYLEGDGHAWQSRSAPSSDPTPGNPLALKLALAANTAGNTVYLARPCQFEARSWDGCEPSVWTQARYGQKNVDALNEAINAVNGAERPLILIGYSGGGVMAALLAAERDDVVGFITVAANMHTQYWTEYHGVSALEGSLNPSNYAARLSHIPQVHLVGDADIIVPPEVVHAYLAALGLEAKDYLVTRPTFDHQCCWADDWDSLYEDSLDLLQSQIGSKLKVM